MMIDEKKIKGMRLSEVIDNLPEDLVLHIGSDTGFFFIGNNVEFYRDVGQIESEYLQTAHKRLKENLKRIKNLTEELKKPRVDFAQTKIVSGKIKTAVEKAQCSEKYLSEFKPIKSREVVSEYKKSNEPGICIIVTGSENGKYWSWEEYKNK